MSSMRDRYGAWALVIGGSSGIGAALATQLAREGLNLILAARTPSKLEAEAEALRTAHQVEVRTVAADLSTAAGAQQLIAAVADVEIGVFVPCAAVEHSGYFVDEPLERHTRMLQLNVISPATLVHHFAGRMAARGRGAVLLVSSLSGWMPQPYMAHYGATKAYILALGDALHHEMKAKGVDVSVLSPGPTDTPMAAGTGIDFAKMGMAVMQPAQVAAAGLAALGRKPDAVPGFRNKFMAFVMTRLMPRRWAGGLFRRMMGKALKIPKAAPANAG